MNSDPEDETLSDAEAFEPEAPESKSQRKRNARQVTDLAAQLVAMKPKILSSLPLDQVARDAINHCAEIKAHGARKRQLHFVSKLLRESDNLEEVQRLVENPELRAAKKSVNPHKIFRDKLLDNLGEHIDQLRSDYPTIDLQQVRQLVRNASAEVKKSEKAHAADDNAPLIAMTDTKAAKSLLQVLSGFK